MRDHQGHKNLPAITAEANFSYGYSNLVDRRRKLVTAFEKLGQKDDQMLYDMRLQDFLSEFSGVVNSGTFHYGEPRVLLQMLAVVERGGTGKPWERHYREILQENDIEQLRGVLLSKSDREESARLCYGKINQPTGDIRGMFDQQYEKIKSRFVMLFDESCPGKLKPHSPFQHEIEDDVTKLFNLAKLAEAQNISGEDAAHVLFRLEEMDVLLKNAGLRPHPSWLELRESLELRLPQEKFYTPDGLG